MDQIVEIIGKDTIIFLMKAHFVLLFVPVELGLLCLDMVKTFKTFFVLMCMFGLVQIMASILYITCIR